MLAKRLLKVTAAALILACLGGCQAGDTLGALEGANAELPAALVKQMKMKGMGVNSPIFVRLFKEESQLEVWKQMANGDYELLKTYSICAWSGKLGPKKTEGDRQAPEGFYTVTPGQLNPESQHHLAFNIGYPNAYDRVNGASGRNIMVHGSCNSSGCYAMDNWQMEELYALARHSFKGGQRAFQVSAYPFRMTPKNMARHRQSDNYAFWKSMKGGYDRFEVTKRPPVVDVCERHYIFDARVDDDRGLAAAGPCPVAIEAPLVAARRISDSAEEEKLLAEMHPNDFVAMSTYSYHTGSVMTAEAYAAEQHRRPGRDRFGMPMTQPDRSGMLISLTK